MENELLNCAGALFQLNWVIGAVMNTPSLMGISFIPIQVLDDSNDLRKLVGKNYILNDWKTILNNKAFLFL
jgi:hypothetical protein